MEQFTPVAAAIGGGLIGLAAAGFILLAGRIAGISGILGGLLAPIAGEWGWRVAFLAGLMAAPFAVSALTGTPFTVTIPVPLPVLLAAGFLVGFGSRLGNGCTSGHGVCGIARGSARSVAATLVFIATGFASVAVLRHLY